jgi:sulfatase modifying factor 1
LERSDTLRIDAAGSSFTFHVNGRVVSQITDAEYEGGEIALYTETFDSSRAHIHFDTLTVQKLAESPAASADQSSAAFYEDDFTDIASGWPQEQEFANYYLGYHEPEYYHVEVHASHDRALVALPDHQFGDFTAESEIFVSISNTDTNGDFIYGLAVRRTGNLYYAFVISPQTQSWQVLKSDASGITTLDQGDDPSIQGLERSDSLRIDAIGPNMAFHINGHVVAQLSDPDYAEGEISLYTETFDSQRAHIHFDSLIIGPAESPPTPTPPPVPPTDTPVPVPAGMVMVPEGSFLMGSPDGPSNERPEHEVSLSAYFIDRLEVSNAQYRECVAAGGCSQAMLASGYTRPGYRDNSEYDEYPVMGVTWAQAAAYCTWAGKRLPTEAEWEYAAGGPDNYTWPWGNEFDPQLSAASAPDTQPVASYPEGASPFGILNMAGNVTEWVQDVYSDTFYANSPVENPVGTGEGNDRIFRGGSFANVDGGAYSTSRRYVKPAAFADVDVGFRCAQDVPSGG